MSDPNPISGQCTAKSKARNARCKNKAIPGGTVCRFHGGAAPQVINKARERLAALVDPAITRLGKLVNEQKDKKVALAAAKDILDRNDLSGKTKHEHSGPDGGPIVSTAIDLSKLSLDTKRQILAELGDD